MQNNRDPIEQLRIQLQNVRLEEERLIAAIAVAELRVERNNRDLPIQPPPPIRVGDRVRITNSRSAIARDRVGIVTRLTPQRTYYTTDSGIQSWRLHHNVAHE